MKDSSDPWFGERDHAKEAKEYVLKLTAKQNRRSLRAIH
jgi:hypothetical protein